MLPSIKDTISASVVNATSESETIITVLRFSRSTTAPENGPRKTCGSKATRVAIASTFAEPVWSVRYQTKANCTSPLPRSETACPIHIGR